MRVLSGQGIPRAVLAVQVVLLAGLAVLAAHTLFGLSAGSNPLFDHWLYDGLMLGAAVLCLARVVVLREERTAWALIGTGLLLWALGDIYWTFVLAGLDQPPFPSLADVGYLSFYPVAMAGLALLVRARPSQARGGDVGQAGPPPAGKAGHLPAGRAIKLANISRATGTEAGRGPPGRRSSKCRQGPRATARYRSGPTRSAPLAAPRRGQDKARRPQHQAVVEPVVEQRIAARAQPEQGVGGEHGEASEQNDLHGQDRSRDALSRKNAHGDPAPRLSAAWGRCRIGEIGMRGRMSECRLQLVGAGCG